MPPQINCNLDGEALIEQSVVKITFQVPLHVSSLGTTQCQDAVLCKNIETERIDTLLVYDDKIAFFVLAVHSLITDGVF